MVTRSGFEFTTVDTAVSQRQRCALGVTDKIVGRAGSLGVKSSQSNHGATAVGFPSTRARQKHRQDGGR